MSGDNGTKPVDKLRQRYFPNALSEIDQLMVHGATTHPHDMEWGDHDIAAHLKHALDHIREFGIGNEIDPDSGQCHLVNAATRLLMALEVYERG